MVFKLTKCTKAEALLRAKRLIACYRMAANEIALNNYLIKNYKIDLKLLCIQLLLNATFNKNADNELVITFKDKNLDKIASFITYGNGKFQGSAILRYALSD